MSVNEKASSKNQISRKLNNTDCREKISSKNNKMMINLSSSENNEKSLMEQKYFSDKMIHNEKKINPKIFEKEKIKGKNNKNELLKENSSNENNKEKEEEKNIIKIENEKDKEEKKPDEINEKSESINNDNRNGMESEINNNIEKENELDNNKEKENENLKEDEIVINIKKEKNNLDIIKEQNIELENKIKDLLFEIKSEETNMNKTKTDCDKRISELNFSIKKQTEINKKVLNKIYNLQNELNTAYEKLVKYFSKNKNNFYNKTKEKIEKQLKIKESQYNYNQKVTSLLMKEINKYNRKIEMNKCIDRNIKKENPSITNKEEEYRFILNKLNEEIDNLKQDIQALKIIKNKHKVCNKIENKLISEKEFYKVEKQKKLDYIDTLNKFKYFQKLRKRKVLIEREQITNLSSNNVISDVKNISAMRRFENSFLRKELENNDQSTISPAKSIALKKINYHLNSSNSTKDINMFQKVKQYEQERIDAERINDKKIILKQRLNDITPNVCGIFPNKLFTDEEKSIFKTFKFIPEEKVNSCEEKYTNMLEQINKTEKKIKNIGKKSEQNYLDFQYKLTLNERKQKDLEKIIITNSITIKQNASKILKIKLLLKEKNKQEKKLDFDLKELNMRYEKLKEIIEISDNFNNIASIEELNDIIIDNLDDKNKNNKIKIDNKPKSDNNPIQINDKGEKIKKENNKDKNNKNNENNKENIGCQIDEPEE